jgi:hypothetical protein
MQPCAPAAFNRIHCDFGRAGADVIAALAVNAIPLTETQLTLLLDYLDGGSGPGGLLPHPEEAGGGGGEIPEDRFVMCMYALSWQHRDAGDASVYAVFPDSDFTTETATGWFKTKRMLWAVRGEGGGGEGGGMGRARHSLQRAACGALIATCSVIGTDCSAQRAV